MNYYGARDLAAAFRTVRENTIRIAEDIPESKYDFVPAPETRSVAQLLKHIAQSTTWQMIIHVNRRTSLDAIDFTKLSAEVLAEEQRPATKAELIAQLKAEGDKFVAWLETLGDEILSEVVSMPLGSGPSTKTRFEMLMSAKEHEMHHRGQLMMIERMLGITPHLTRRMQNSAHAHANLGIALAQKGLLSEARREFEEALRINPQHAAARAHRAALDR